MSLEDRLRHLPQENNKPNIEDLLAKQGGVEPASPELIDLISKKREVFIAESGSHDEAYLNSIPAEASASPPDRKSILFRKNPSKAVVLEEYIHGIQYDLGIIDRHGENYAEWHANDFMIRNANKMGFNQEDVKRLEANRSAYAALPEVQEMTIFLTRSKVKSLLEFNEGDLSCRQ